MDIPSLFMIPSAVSSGKVHSVFPNSTDSDFQFNRDSDATRVNSEGLIERVGYYGSELVTNGSFNADTNWSKDGWKIENGKAINTLASSGLNLYQGSVTSVGNTFKVVLDAVISAGGLKVLLGGGSGGYNEIGQASSTGTHTFTGVSNGTDNRILIQTLSGSTIGSVIVDNVSVKQINGDRARLNYEIEGGLVNTKPSLLLEPQSTNLVTYSEDFSQSVWNTGTSRSYILTATNDINPTGLSSSYKFKGTAIDNQFAYIHYTTIGTTITNSIYVKRVSGTGEVKLRDVNNSNTDFNLSVADGWKRISVTAAATSTTARFYLNLATIGDEILIFGAQQEALSYPTSYIPTNGSTQTRAAETCNGAGTSSILPSEEGILYAEVSTNADSNFKRISIHSGSYVNSVFFDFDNTNNLYGKVIVGGSAVVTIIASGLNIENNNKIALSYKENDFKLFVNGSKVGTDVTGSTPTGLNNLSFDLAGGQDFYGKIRDIRVYNTKEMTDSEVDILLTKITS